MKSEKTLIDGIQKVVHNILEKMNVDAKVEIAIEEEENVRKVININMKGNDMGHLIGSHGATLNSLQIVIAAIVLKEIEEDVQVIIDINNYRGKRKEYLINLAIQAMQQAIDSGQDTELPPMNPFERRIVHMALKDKENISTESIGEGEARRVVVSLNPDSQ